jgi:hypothetical protein
MTPEQVVALAVGFGLEADKITSWSADAATHTLTLGYDGDPPVTYNVIPVCVVNNSDLLEE